MQELQFILEIGEEVNMDLIDIAVLGLSVSTISLWVLLAYQKGMLDNYAHKVEHLDWQHEQLLLKQDNLQKNYELLYAAVKK